MKAIYSKRQIYNWAQKDNKHKETTEPDAFWKEFLPTPKNLEWTFMLTFNCARLWEHDLLKVGFFSSLILSFSQKLSNVFLIAETEFKIYCCNSDLNLF